MHKSGKELKQTRDLQAAVMSDKGLPDFNVYLK